MPETYNSVMNAIFSAQKAGVLVDCAVLGESSTFLQQAAYLTSERAAGGDGALLAHSVACCRGCCFSTVGFLEVHRSFRVIVMHLIVGALVLGVLQSKCRAPERRGRIVPPVQFDVGRYVAPCTRS